MKYSKKKVLVALFLIAVLLCLSVSAVYASGKVTVSARAAVLYQPLTDTFLYTKNADAKLPMASTTKIMTALVAIENGALDERISADPRAVGTEGSSLYLKAGEIITMRDLIIGLMLRSANDAAAAIAYAISGDIAEFAELMNERAASLGLQSTNFVNPHGLDDPNHYTTARELAILAAEAMKNETFKEIVSLRKYVIKTSLEEPRIVINHNKLLTLYDSAIGVKTGFTKKSGRCLVGASERDGLQFITVTINAPDDWNDHVSLFEYGYSVLESKVLARTGEFCYKLPVLDTDMSYLTVKNAEELRAILEKSHGEITHSVNLPRFLSAPVSQGDVIGTVTFKENGKFIAELPLVAESSIPKQKKSIFSIF